MKKTLLLSLWLVPFLIFGQGISFSPTSIFYTQIQGDNGAFIYGDHNHTNALNYDLNGLITSNASGIFQYRGGTGLMLSNKVTTGNMVFTNGSITLTQPSNTLAPLVINTNWLCVTNGSVGIGTSAGYSKLSFGSTAPNVTSRIAFYEGANGTAFRGVGMDNPSAGVYGVGVWAKGSGVSPTDANVDLFIQDGGAVGIGTTAGLAKLSINGGLHVGGDSDPGDNNGLIDNTLSIGTLNTSYALNVEQGNFCQVMIKGNSAADIMIYASGSAVNTKWTGIRSTAGMGEISSYNDAGTYNKRGIVAWNNTNAYVGINTIAPNSQLHVAGSIATSIAIGGSCTLSATNSTYLLNVNAGNVTNLTAVGCAGRILTIKAIAPCASGTIYFNGSETIDGAPTYSLSASNKFVVYQSDGSGWQIIGNN